MKFSSRGTVLFKVHSKLCKRRQPAMGPDLSKCQMKVGPCREKRFPRSQKSIDAGPRHGIFKQGAETRVFTDAFPVGIAAVLEQK